MDEDIVVVGMARTPFGSFRGTLSSLSAPQLGAIAIKEALRRANVSPEQVTEVIMGNVLGAGSGQAPARQAAIYAGIPHDAYSMTINKVCGSGMKAITLAMQSLRTGESEIVVAGGMESMSQAPYILKKLRDGVKIGHQTMVDSMVHDGLWDPYSDQHMGSCAELCAKENELTREEQDAFATESFKRAQKAWEEKKFAAEITPVEIKSRKETLSIDTDEEPSKVKFEKIPKLRPAFSKDGTITAANASTINDGACACVLTTRRTATKLGLKPLAKIVTSTRHAQKPEWFTTAPIQAIQKALEKAHWKMNEVDLFEVNEAFAVVPLSVQKALNIPSEKLNIWGGAIALGHPIGASGARIMMTLISALKDQKKKRGVAAICIGGGEGMALCIQKEDDE